MLVELVSAGSESGEVNRSGVEISSDGIKMRFLIVSCAGLLCGVGTVFAEGGIDLKVSADCLSKYIWRGQNISDESVFQQSVSLSKWGFTGSVWGNLDLKNENDNAGDFTDLDFTVDYTAKVPGVDWMSLSVGAIHYQFPSTNFRPTTEIYGGLGLSVPFSPSIRIYRDVDEIDGGYVQLGIGHTFEKIAGFSKTCYCGLQLGAALGYGGSQYNKGYFGVKEGKFNDLTLSAGFPICIGPQWTVRPSISYSTMLSDSIRTATANSGNLWMGIGILASF